MEKSIKIVLVKFFIMLAAVVAYIYIMSWIIAPHLVQQVYGLWEKEQSIRDMQPLVDLIKQFYQNAYGQSAFDTPNQFNPDPYNQQYSQQYQQPYQQQYGYNQYQQPYMQQPYGYQQQYIPQAQNPIQFGTSEVIYTLLGGGAIGYARYNQHKRNQDKEVQRDLAAELLKEKLEKREFARVAYQQMPNQGNDIKDAPNIRLQKLDSDIQELSEKVSKI